MYLIALQMLFGERGKYLAMVLGLTFASLIMTQQPSIYLGLISRTYAYINELSLPDIWVMDPSVQFVEENKAMRDTELQRVRGLPNVEWAVPLHKMPVNVRVPDGSRRMLEVSGLDDATLIGAPKQMLEGSLESLRQQDGMIIDELAATERLAYTGSDGRRQPIRVGDVLEINDQRVVVVGIAKMQRTFSLMPMGFTTYSRAVQLSPQERRKLSYILVKVKPGADQEAVVTQIRNDLQLSAYTAEEFKDVTAGYWMKNTGIPINFGIAIGLGFFIGAAVAGQTFYGFVRDNMKQYAALKAMGTQNDILIRMVLLQALVVGGIGYGLGVGITAIFGTLMTDTTLAFLMSPSLLLFSGLGIAVIVLCSALVALRTVIRVDPSTVFRS